MIGGTSDHSYIDSKIDVLETDQYACRVELMSAKESPGLTEKYIGGKQNLEKGKTQVDEEGGVPKKYVPRKPKDEASPPPIDQSRSYQPLPDNNVFM